MLVDQCLRLENLRVLIVDDQMEVRFPLIVMLQLYGAQVMEAGSVREALQVLETRSVDVVLSDIQMSHEDGYSLIHQLKTLFPSHQERPTAIAMTGLSAEESREQALTAGFQAYLSKPFEVAELVMTVSVLLAQRVEAERVSEHLSVATQVCGVLV